MLSPQAEQMIYEYLNLPFKDIAGIRCPYLNNSRHNQRGQLRVLVGKGTPAEIVEEAHIISVHYHNGLFDKNGNCCLHNDHIHHPAAVEKIRRFLIDNNLGIECSGFVTQVLRVHFQETKQKDIVNEMRLVNPARLLRWLISRLRPVENINVKTYADSRNSIFVIDAKKAFDPAALQAGDFIILLETGPGNKRNHIILIRDIQKNVVNYVHARAWTNEGQFGHGVSEGTITISKPKAGILEQTWEENGFTGNKNETYLEAKQAKTFEIRRLKA